MTSLVDFYGFEHKQPDEALEDLEARIDEAVQQRDPHQSRTVTQFACVQQHQFEASLFADPAGFEVLPDLPPDATRALGSVAQQFATPEEINDHRETAPGKRIQSIIPSYHKRLHGPLAAGTVGLETTRASHPRLHAWVTHLGSL